MSSTTETSGKTTTEIVLTDGRFDAEYLDTYLALCAKWPLAPIRNDEVLNHANEVVWWIAARGEDNLSRAELDYLYVLSDLIEVYEKVHYPFPKPKSTPAEMLAFLVEQHDMTASDLGNLLGNRSLGSKLLRGERKPSKAHALKLAEHFHVDAALFLG